MFIKEVSKNVVDVFIGKGWVQWVRVQKNGTIIKRVTGTIVPDDRLMNVLKNKIKWM